MTTGQILSAEEDQMVQLKAVEQLLNEPLRTIFQPVSACFHRYFLNITLDLIRLLINGHILLV